MSEVAVNIKIKFGEDRRRFALASSLRNSFAGFRQHVLKLFSLPDSPAIVFRFRDEEEDWCTVSSEEEWREALAHVAHLSSGLLALEVVIVNSSSSSQSHPQQLLLPENRTDAVIASIMGPQTGGVRLTEQQIQNRKHIIERIRMGVFNPRPKGPWPKLTGPLPPVITKKPAQLSEERKSDSGDLLEEKDEWEVINSDLALEPKESAPTKEAKPLLSRFKLPERLGASYSNSVTFYVNGQVQTVANPDPQLKLVDYLRNRLGLTGTKIGCGEGGCGACTVVLARDHPINGVTSFSANACLHPVCSLDGYAVTTTEGLGSERTGFHPIQSQLAACDGSQCGYCSPGMVMSMYGVLAQNPTPSLSTVENGFDGNICRCTGYRAILKAMHSFAAPTEDEKGSPKLKLEVPESKCGSHQPKTLDLVGPQVCATNTCCDIEDICDEKKMQREKQLVNVHPPAPPVEFSPSQHLLPFPQELVGYKRKNAYYVAQDAVWFTPSSLQEVYQLLDQYSEAVVRLVVGNTSIGVAKYYVYNPLRDDPYVFIDVAAIPELVSISSSSTGLTVGASVTLASLITALNDNIAQGGIIFDALIRHLKVVGNNQVRNVASWAGNLMLHNAHPNFASDVATMLSAASASLTIASPTATQTVDVPTFLNMTLKPDQIILNMTIPYPTGFMAAKAKQSGVSNPQGSVLLFDTFKVAGRHQNSHALINSGFALMTDAAGTSITYAALYFGGLDSGLRVCSTTASYLLRKPLNAQTLAGALPLLQQEVTPGPDPPSPNWVLPPAAYRVSLALAEFYKFYLSSVAKINPSSVPATLTSAYTKYQRGISAGTEVFTPYAPEAPVGQPIHKLSSTLQASGEAVYSDDMPNPLTGLQGALVLATVPSATINSIDASVALTMPGVVGFISAQDIKDIGGSNNCGLFPGDEEVFASTTITHVGQSLGMIVADTRDHAQAAAKAVIVNSTPSATPPVFTIKDAIAANSFLNDNDYVKHMAGISAGDVTKGFADADVTYEGELYQAQQAHFYMETQVTLAVPDENDCLNVYTSSQGPASIRPLLCTALNMPANKIIVSTKRAGGGFGGKLSRDAPVSSAVSVAARKLGRPVRMQLDRNSDMKNVGKRHDHYAKYKVGAKKDGTVTALQIDFYSNGGASYDATLGCMDMCQLWADNTYFWPNYASRGFCVRTNLPSNTAMRAPGALNSIFMIESVLERVATELSLDSKAVREKNFLKEGQMTPYQMPVTNVELPSVWSQLQTLSDYANRLTAVNTFNANNRWRKRGIRMTPVKYAMGLAGYQAACIVNVFADDGSIQVAHSGTEIGQGVNTKVAQCVAYKLGVDLSLISITTTSTEKIPNFTNTGGSGTSETCCQAAINACESLNALLAPIKQANPKMTWPQLIAAASAAGVNLSSTGFFAMPAGEEGGYPFTYFVYAAACTEVELDVLTGEIQVLRSDIVYDGGYSLNYAIDIGQVEGAFVQGLGFFFLEDVVTNNGRMVNCGTWDYKPPGAQDIPIQFNVTFLADTPNPVKNSILSSKATGEPPYMLAASAFFAAKDAVLAARVQNGLGGGFFNIDTPATVDKLALACGTTIAQLNLDA